MNGLPLGGFHPDETYRHPGRVRGERMTSRWDDDDRPSLAPVVGVAFGVGLGLALIVLAGLLALLAPLALAVLANWRA